MKYRCKCHEDSPFHWKHNPRPSIFLQDPYVKAATTLSLNQTLVVERKRERGEDIGNIPGVTEKERNIINVRQFNIFSRAGQVL